MQRDLFVGRKSCFVCGKPLTTAAGLSYFNSLWLQHKKETCKECIWCCMEWEELYPFQISLFNEVWNERKNNPLSNCLVSFCSSIGICPQWALHTDNRSSGHDRKGFRETKPVSPPKLNESWDEEQRETKRKRILSLLFFHMFAHSIPCIFCCSFQGIPRQLVMKYVWQRRGQSVFPLFTYSCVGGHSSLLLNEETGICNKSCKKQTNKMRERRRQSEKIFMTRQ